VDIFEKKSLSENFTKSRKYAIIIQKREKSV